MINIHSVARWNRSRLSSLFFENTKKNSEFNEQRAFQFFFGNIVPKKEFELTEDLIETYKKYTVVQPGDIMINGLNLNYDFVTQRVGLVKNNGIMTSAYLSLRARSSDINNRYYCYLLKTVDAQKMFHGLGTGIRLTLSFDDIKNFRIPVPPRDEQDQIVRFLDWKVSTVNKLINAKRQEIKSLVELKRSMVCSIVTRGLSQNVPMKYSGVKWLGDIPAHWEIVPLCAIAKEKSICGCVDLPLLSVYLDEGVILFSEKEEKRTNVTSKDLSKYQRVDPGDFVLNNQQAWRGSVGVSNHTGIVSPAYIVASLDDTLNITYANYLLRSRKMVDQYLVISRGVGSIQRNIYWTSLKRVVVPVPPKEEQKMIVSNLEESDRKLSEAADRLMREIETLEEYKTKLIADVVTGKIDVRGFEIPEYEFVEEVGSDEVDENSDNTDEQEDLLCHF